MVRRRTVVLVLREGGIAGYLLVGARCTDARSMTGPHDQSCTSLLEFARTMRSEWRVNRARVLLDLPAIQVRTIDGLPHTNDAEVVERIVATNPFRYFLRYTDRPVVSRAVIEQPGVATVAILDGDLIESVVRSVRASGLVVDAVAVSRNRGPAVTQEAVACDDLDALWPGALQVPSSAWGSNERRGMQWWRPRGGSVSIAAACLLGAALHPAWQLLQLHQHERQARASRQSTLLAARRTVALDSLRIPLERLHAAATASVHPLGVLDVISTILPDEGRVVAFDVDTARVEVTVSTPSLAMFLHRLERNPHVTGLALVGGISHDSSGTDAPEGAVVRFRFRAGETAQQ